MQSDLHHLRKSYDKDALLEENLDDDPYVLFDHWFEMAKNHPDIEEANAMGLATLGADGFPKNRIVLLKAIDEKEFLFYTNYTSEKGEAIQQHPKVSLHFFWPALERQVTIKGKVTQLSKEKSAAYFHSRPRGSQIGAWSSEQSSEIVSRQALEERLTYYEQKFEGQEIPLPDFWGGYGVQPVSFEFWQGRPNRMHDRILYEQEQGGWKFKRLQP
ncbi:pyridoxamine 5'-phosphate oxidase [Nonlabens xiamenensis]|uniref:pyridoxamine 5'-phosphate oxidase n=1 Tax=Nonlabens xiamenensis TaxID=2341043 RepID=UPI000F6104ED|nr:pyridoxamine 5'-phosphate oxidase [Nonlabens xiamenensis]